MHKGMREMRQRAAVRLVTSGKGERRHYSAPARAASSDTTLPLCCHRMLPPERL